jgi:Xaa-Pro aminopeptidase
MLINTLQTYLSTYHVDAIIIPIFDQYKKYKTNITDNLLCKITGFTGSNATLIINKTGLKHAFFTDGRYLVQAKAELNLNEFDIYDIAELSPIEYCNNYNIKSIGYDPYVLNNSYLLEINMVAIKELSEQIAINKNHISHIENYNIIYSGITVKEKLSMLLFNADYLFLNNAESINWLLNIRGNDIQDTPVKLGYAFISKNKEVFLFCDQNNNDLEIYNTTILSSAEIENFIKNISTNIIQLDKKQTSQYFLDKFDNIDDKIDPCLNLRSIKNKIEQARAEEIHIQDGIALVQFIYWLKNLTSNISEIDISNKLLELRSKNKNFISESFSTIAGYAENSAIIHYHATKNTNKIIYNSNILLVDSGGHYLGGTTDVTRSFHLGNPSHLQKNIYTKVLKGHIALASLIFPKNTKGYQIDAIARQYLWQSELNYAHGTGHGVGNCLSVHEGPISISSANINHPLKDGMIVSIEPGCYFEGEFGIRLENLYLIKKYGNSSLHFEYLTMAPFELNLIEFGNLTKEEINWLTSYHQKIYDNLLSYLDQNIIQWYKEQYIKQLK